MFLNFFNSFNLTSNVGYRKSTRQISQQFIKNYFLFYLKKRIIWEALPVHCMRRRCLAEGRRWGSPRQAPRGYSGLKTYRNNTLREWLGSLAVLLHEYFTPNHKVLTYIEYTAVSGVFRIIDSPPSECVLRPHQRLGGTHSLGGEEVGG